MLPGELFGDILEVEYAWEGAPGASPSVKKVGGKVVARNLVHDPGFEYGLDGVQLNLAVDRVIRNAVAERVHSGEWSARTRGIDHNSAVAYVWKDIADVTGGSWVGLAAQVMGENVQSARAALRVAFLGSGLTTQYVWASPVQDVRGQFHRLTGAVQIPDGYTSAQIMVYMYSDSGNLGGGWTSHDDWMLSVGSSEHAALAQIAEFFDGDTPDVYRTHDDSVRQYTSRILVNGVEREADTWSVGRELQGDLPKQVAAVSGVTQATGNIDWTPAHVVSEHSPNPWNANGGWVPSRGDRVEIFVSDGVTEWKRFHGLIDITRGDVGAGFTSTIIDDYDKLSASVAHSPMLSIMPPRTISGTGWWRLPGIHPLYYVDWALRRSRFYVTPPREANSLLDVPMQGSLWPHWGVLDRNDENMASGGANRVAPWGLAKGDFVAYYAPSSSPSMSQTAQMSFMVAPDHGSATDLTLDYGAGDYLRVSVSGSRTISVLKNGTTIASLTLGPDDVVVSALFKNGEATVRTNTRREASGSFTASGSGMSEIRINAGTDASIAGFQVSRPQTATHEHFSTRVPLSARLDVTSLRLSGGLAAAPNIEDRTAESLISEINDAILAAMWIDETGVMQWAQSDTLRRRDPVKTATTADDIFSFSWESGLLQSAASVTVNGKRPAITRSRWRVITVAEESGRQTLRGGDELEIFFEASSDEDWVSPSFDFVELGGSTGIWGPFNNPEYGTVGLYYERDGEEVTGTTYPVTITTERLGNQKTLIKYAAGNWPSDVEGVLSTPPEETAFTVLWPRHRGQPAVRQKAMGRIEWYDDKQTMTGAGGPGPELVHDVGVWSNMEPNIGSVDYWERIGAYIQSQVTVPQPVVRGVSISPDPRLQLADVTTIESHLLGVKLDSMVTSLSEGFDASGYHQDLDVRVLSSETTSLTYAAFQQGLTGTNLTYEQWQALGPLRQTYSNFNDEGA